MAGRLCAQSAAVRSIHRKISISAKLRSSISPSWLSSVLAAYRPSRSFSVCMAVERRQTGRYIVVSKLQLGWCRADPIDGVSNGVFLRETVSASHADAVLDRRIVSVWACIALSSVGGWRDNGLPQAVALLKVTGTSFVEVVSAWGASEVITKAIQNIPL